MQQLREFKYRKEDLSLSIRSVIALNETDETLVGIDLGKLDDNERREFLAATETYTLAVSRVAGKAFRNFKKSNIIP